MARRANLTPYVVVGVVGVAAIAGLCVCVCTPKPTGFRPYELYRPPVDPPNAGVTSMSPADIPSLHPNSRTPMATDGLYPYGPNQPRDQGRQQLVYSTDPRNQV